MRPPPPDIPADLLDQFGPPEAAFGPNTRFRAASAAMGAFLMALGMAFFVLGFASLLAYLGGGLMAVGAAAFFLPRSVPRNWVFVCPGGLIRTRGADWEAVAWADVARFEEVAAPGTMVAVRQCRIVTAAGAEWGFMADWVGDFKRLAALLRQKAEAPPPAADD